MPLASCLLPVHPHRQLALALPLSQAENTHFDVHTGLAMSPVTTRVFMNGNSQAVRIPQEFRLNANQVQIERTAQGDLLIRPLPPDRGMALLQALQAFDDEASTEWLSRLLADRGEQPPTQERDPL